MVFGVYPIAALLCIVVFIKYLINKSKVNFKKLDVKAYKGCIPIENWLSTEEKSWHNLKPPGNAAVV